MKLYLILCVALLCSTNIFCQLKRPVQYNTYNNTTTISVVQNNSPYRLDSLVKKHWPEKHVVSISAEEFEKVKSSDRGIYILLESMHEEHSTTRHGTSFVRHYYGPMSITIRIGKSPLRDLDVFPISWSEICYKQLPERLEMTFKSLKYQLDTYYDNSYRGAFMYKLHGYKDELANGVLLIQKSKIQEGLTTVDIVKNYPYKFGILEDKDWEKKIRAGESNFYFVDVAEGTNISAVNIFRVSDGICIYRSYPWYGKNFMLYDKVFQNFVL